MILLCRKLPIKLTFQLKLHSNETKQAKLTYSEKRKRYKRSLENETGCKQQVWCWVYEVNRVNCEKHRSRFRCLALYALVNCYYTSNIQFNYNNKIRCLNTRVRRVSRSPVLSHGHLTLPSGSSFHSHLNGSNAPSIGVSFSKHNLFCTNNIVKKQIPKTT